MSGECDDARAMALLTAAAGVLDKAYCPYSGFAVGAALLCTDGTVFTGRPPLEQPNVQQSL